MSDELNPLQNRIFYKMLIGGNTVAKKKEKENESVFPKKRFIVISNNELNESYDYEFIEEAVKQAESATISSNDIHYVLAIVNVITPKIIAEHHKLETGEGDNNVD